MPSLNIKNDETHRLAASLAHLRGVSLVAAITQSVREALEREMAERDRRVSREGLADRLMAIASRTAPLMADMPDSAHAADFLYDEVGLPR